MRSDVVVIGGGVNGLVAAALIARAGPKTLLLERRPVVGGAAVTEELHPGFRASTVSSTAGPFRAGLARTFGLRRLGVEFILPEPRVFAPLPDGRSLRLWGDPGLSAKAIHRFSPKDAERYVAFHRSLSRVSALLSRLLKTTPPDVEAPDLRDLWHLAGLGMGLRRLGRDDAHRLLRWGPMAVADFASEWFDTDLLRAVACARGIVGAFAGPRSPGTTANLLLQAAAGDGNAAGATVFVKGGLGSLTSALATAARRFGAEIRTGAEVKRITTREGRVTGVVLVGGEEIAAGAVVSGADPHRTFLGLIDPSILDPVDLWRIQNYRIRGTASKVNFALAALPSFAALEGQDAAAALRGRIHIGPSVDDLERAFDDAKYGGISRRPYLDVTIPSLSDPTLAAPTRHVMSVYVQYTPYRLKSGDWTSRREGVGDLVVRMLEEYAPGFGSLVLGRQVLTPLDLEEIYGLTGGHPFHGEPALDQLFTMRPLLGWARYRGPIDGLYLCGAGTHPGGGVTGGPGENAAREILRHLRSRGV